jgi:hypothetical protein
MSKARSTGNISNVIKTSTTCVTVTDGTTDLLIISGSGRVTIPGDLVVLGGIAGSSAESASYSLSSSFATNANLLDGIDGASFLQTGSFNAFSSSIDTTIKNKLNNDGVISGSVQVDITSTTGYSTFSSSLSSSIGSLSGSVATTTSGLAGRITTVEGNYATTGSNTFIGDQTITGSICSNGNIVTTGQIVAQTINVQQVTSSIVYSCGSNTFGCSLTNNQVFTGSVFITGSNINANVDNVCFQGSVCAQKLRICSTGDLSYIYNSGASTTDANFYIYNSTSDILMIRNSGCVGLNTANPQARLDIAGNNNNATCRNTLRFTDTDTGTQADQQIGKIEFYSSDTSSPGAGVKAYMGAFASDSTPDAYLAFATQDGSLTPDPVERLRITSEGNLQVGYSGAPNIAGKLFISRGDQYGLTINAFSGGNCIISTDDNMYFTFGTTPALRMICNLVSCFAGTVCAPSFVGGAITGTTLTLSTATSDYSATITNIQDSSQGLLIRTTDNDTSLNILSLQSSPNSVCQSWIDRFVVTKAGDVGIGVSTPGSKLEIRGLRSATKDSLLLLSKFDYGTTTFYQNYSNTFYTNGKSLEVEVEALPLLQLATNNAGNAGKVIFPNGSVGIGISSPSYKLEVCGPGETINIIGASSGDIATGFRIGRGASLGAQIYDNPQDNITTINAAGGLNLRTGGSGRLSILSTGIACFACRVCAPTLAAGGRTVVYGGGIYDDTINGNNIGIGFAATGIVPIDGAGNAANGTKDLGSSSARWCTVYTSDLSLNNGIGNYTIVEGENDLFIYNNNSCKVYKFLLQEVCPGMAPAKRSI